MDGDSQSSKTYGAVTGIAGKSDVTTANVSSLNETLENSFDKTAVETQFGAQVQVSQAFDTERRTYRLEMAQEQQKTVEEAKKHPVGSAEYNRLMDEANKQQEKMVLFDSITGAIYGPNTNGATGYVAKAVSPQVAYQIGQYFKNNDAQNEINQNTELAGTQSPQHLLAHALLGAAVSAATGNDALTGGISASSGEVTATLLSKYVYKVDDPSELTAEQKDTISNITTLAGVAIGSTTGEVTDAVNAGETAKVAVEDNANVSVEVGGNITIGKGYGADVGVFITTGNAFEEFSIKNPKINFSELDAGVKVTGAKTVGFGAGAGVSGTITSGGRENIDGKSTTDTVCVAGPCVGSVRDSSGKFVGATGSLGGNADNGALPGGSFTQSQGSTKSVTIQDAVKKTVKKTKEGLSSLDRNIRSLYE